MSRKRKPRRRTVNRTDRSSGVRQNKQLSFDQLEARHLLATFVVNSTADTVDSADGVVTPVSYTHPPSPRDQRGSRMPSSA